MGSKKVIGIAAPTQPPSARRLPLDPVGADHRAARLQKPCSPSCFGATTASPAFAGSAAEDAFSCSPLPAKLKYDTMLGF
jgi:hypothetical protein